MAILADAPAVLPPWMPLLIFLAEMCVVTIGTIRIIFVARGLKVLASVLGFFEICTWLFAISQIMQNLNNISCFVAFAGGFTAGNYLGILIEKHLALGTLVLQTITNRHAGGLIERLRLAGYGVTTIDGQGGSGPVKIVFSVIKRRELSRAVALVRAFDPQAFYAVDEIKEATGILGSGSRRMADRVRSLLHAVYPSRKVEVLQRVTATYDGAREKAA